MPASDAKKTSLQDIANFHVSNSRCETKYLKLFLLRKEIKMKTITLLDYNLEKPQVEAKYVGVRGWLLLFCLILVVISPLFNVIIFIVTLDKVTPYFEQFSGLKTPFVIGTILDIALMVFSIYAGISLWQIRPNAVSIAKTFLGFYLGVTILGIFLPITGNLPPELLGHMIKEGFKQTFPAYTFYWIWSSYLNKSKRVAVTYLNCHPQISV
jgi:hypothetical protein